MTKDTIFNTVEMDETIPSTGILPLPCSFRSIDHIALSVIDLEQAVTLFRDTLGFELKCRREVQGKVSGMIAAEMEGNGLRFVLCQGTNAESVVSQLIANFGPGVAHIALEVEDVDAAVADLKERGLGFDTNVIHGPGLTQAFSTRCMNTGMSFEIISRDGEEGFVQSNVESLFDQLQQSGKY